MIRRASMLLPALAAGLVNGAVANITDDKLLAAVGVVVSTVGLTMAVVSWMDRRIEHKLRNGLAPTRVMFRLMLREISGLRELMGHPPLDEDGIVKLVAVGEKE